MLTFDPAGHSYSWEGRRIPSVTEILRSRMSHYFNQSAASRGTAVHEATAKADRQGKNWEAWLVMEAWDPDLEPFLMAYRQFRLDSGFVPEMIEVPSWGIVNGLLYAGTYDRLGTLNGRPCLIDIKTGYKADWHSLQLEAYSRLAGMPEQLDRFCLYLRKTGRYALESHPAVYGVGLAWESAIAAFYGG